MGLLRPSLPEGTPCYGVLAQFATTGDLLRAFAAAIWLLEKRTGKKWNEDRDTAGQLGAVVQEFIFEALHKKGMAPPRR